MLNIFQHLRDLKVDLTDKDLFVFEAATHYDGGLCYDASTKGGPASVIVDGNAKTAWTSKAMHSSSAQKVIIDFKERRVAIRNYTLKTLCNPPIDLFIEGSNNKLSWTVLSYVPTTLKENAFNTFFVNNRKSFRYIRIRQR